MPCGIGKAIWSSRKVVTGPNLVGEAKREEGRLNKELRKVAISSSLVLSSITFDEIDETRPLCYIAHSSFGLLFTFAVSRQGFQPKTRLFRSAAPIPHDLSSHITKSRVN